MLTVWIAILVFVLVKVLLWMKSEKNVPPGPSGWEICKKMANKTLNIDTLVKDCKRKYGDIYTLNLSPWNRTIVISGMDNIKRVFVDYADITSNRPEDYFFKYVLSQSGK